MEVKDAKISSLINLIKLLYIRLERRNSIPATEFVVITMKKIWNYSDNVILCIKVDFKSLKHLKLCDGTDNIYAHGHAILAESACIY
jgi:hypothetical protein